MTLVERILAAKRHNDVGAIPAGRPDGDYCDCGVATGRGTASPLQEQNPNTVAIPALEAEIDRLVYALYDLTVVMIKSPT